MIAITGGAVASIGANDHRGDPLPDNRLDAGIFLHSAIAVRMDVNEAGRYRESPGVDLVRPAFGDAWRNSGDECARNCDVHLASFGTRAIEYRSAPNHDVVCSAT